MLAIILCAAAAAQSPDERWRMVETDNFRVHYPTEFERWSLYTAARLEAVRARVAAEVGYAPTRPADVVVTDPIAEANGFALPLVNRPSIGLFPTAAPPTSFTGFYRSWPEELAVHEDTHLVHLLRPSRNGPYRILTFLLGVRRGPILVGIPRWVTEGYATVVEGRVTGFGRPNSDARAAFLRGLAAEGALPTYTRLDTRRGWASSAYPYLIGSAFLEWLEDRTRPGALRDLWARLTAVELRSFEEAFVGVFGEDPEVLYRRFVAELTYDALCIERVRPEDATTLWQDLDDHVGAPAVSPDGSHVAVIRRPRRGPPRLVVYSTAPDPAARRRWELVNLPDVQQTDPQDVALVLPRDPSNQRILAGYTPTAARWADERTLLFTSFVADGKGDLRPELFRWSLGGTVSAVTRHAGVRDADPQGGRAFGLQSDGGVSRLVRVDLRTGAVVALTDDGPDVVLAGPRVHPEGVALAFLANRGAGWQIEVAPLTQEGEFAGPPTVVGLPQGADPLSVAWRGDGDGLVASLGVGGFIELYELGVDRARWEQLTRTRGGALLPETTPDGRAVFYLVPDARGLDLHMAVFEGPERGPGRQPDPEVITVLEAGSPVVAPPPAAVPPLVHQQVVAEKYGVGRAHIDLALGATRGPQQESSEVGLFVGDIVGRYEAVPFVSVRGLGLNSTLPDLLVRSLEGTPTSEPMTDTGGLGYRGARVALTWRGLPVRLRLDGVHLDLGSKDPDWIGVLDVFRRQLGPHTGLEARVSGLWVVQDGGRHTAGVDARVDAYAQHWHGPLFLGVGADLGAQAWRASGDTPMRAGGWLGWGTERFVLGAEAEVVGGDVVLGGVTEPLFPEAYTTNRLWAPGLPRDVRTGLDSVRRVRADVSFAPIGLFAERHAVLDDRPAPMAEDGVYTRLGLEAKGAFLPRPLLAKPGLYLEGGVACVAETPEEGWRPNSCLRLGHYGGWLSLRIQPGRETGIPHSPREAASR